MGSTSALEIWWDPICPWCYLGLLDLEATLATVPPADRPTITWRAFELDPGAGRFPRRTALEVMAEHEPRAAVLERLVRVGELAATHGVTLNTATAHPVSSFDAHRVALLAQDRGRFEAVAKRLLHAYHTENRTIADRDVLVELCERAGLDRAEVAAMLRTPAWSDRVAADRRQAKRVGLRGVPGVLVDGRQPRPRDGSSSTVVSRLPQSGLLAPAVTLLLGALSRRYVALEAEGLELAAESTPRW